MALGRKLSGVVAPALDYLQREVASELPSET